MSRKKRQRRSTHMRFRKNDPAHNLLAATQHWLKANGGDVVVIGGIGILNEEHPLIEDTKGKFRVCIGCLGRPPKKLDAAAQ